MQQNQTVAYEKEKGLYHGAVRTLSAQKFLRPQNSRDRTATAWLAAGENMS